MRSERDNAGFGRAPAEALAGRLPPLLVGALRVASTVAQGVHGRRRVGQGESFWQFRHYVWGDPVRSIDWRQSARGDHVFVRENEWEAAQSVWLWRDGSASMDYASSRDLPRKRDRAELLLLALAALLLRGGERVALADEPDPPRGGRDALERLIAQLHRQNDAGLPAARPLPRHAELVLIGDLLSPVDEIRALIERHVGQGVRGHLLQVLDPVEASLPFTGRVRVEGMESEPSTLLSHIESVRGGYLERLRQQQQALRDLSRAAGWSFTVHLTDRPPETALLSLYVALAERPETRT